MITIKDIVRLDNVTLTDEEIEILKKYLLIQVILGNQTEHPKRS